MHRIPILNSILKSLSLSLSISLSLSLSLSLLPFKHKPILLATLFPYKETNIQLYLTASH